MKLSTRDRPEEMEKDQAFEARHATRGAFWKNKLIAASVPVLVASILISWGAYELRMLWTSYASALSSNRSGTTNMSFRNVAIRGALTTLGQSKMAPAGPFHASFQTNRP
jgi:hypothetical protein